MVACFPATCPITCHLNLALVAPGPHVFSRHLRARSLSLFLSLSLPPSLPPSLVFKPHHRPFHWNQKSPLSCPATGTLLTNWRWWKTIFTQHWDRRYLTMPISTRSLRHRKYPNVWLSCCYKVIWAHPLSLRHSGNMISGETKEQARTVGTQVIKWS